MVNRTFGCCCFAVIYSTLGYTNSIVDAWISLSESSSPTLYLNIWNLWFSNPFVAEEKNNLRTVVDNAGIRFSLFFVYTGANFALRELTLF
jgi:hypothetical protein